MQKTTEHGGAAPANGPLDGLGSIVGDLICLIEHVQSSIAAIEADVAREQLCSNSENAGNVIVLDDVTPRYARASAALSVCRAKLTTALHVLADNRGSARQSQRWG
jgi:hypothetical protein